MSFLESHRRRKRQDRRARDTALDPEDAGAVRWGASSHHSFLGHHRRLPIAAVEVDNSPAPDIRRPLDVDHPIGSLLRQPWLLCRWQEVEPGVAPRKDELLGGQCGGDGAVEAAMRRLAARLGGNGGRLAESRIRENERNLVVAHQQVWPTRFSPCAGAPARPLWIELGLGAPDEKLARAGRFFLGGQLGKSFTSNTPIRCLEGHGGEWR
jgi:hypothetical protein